ncbi:hypothetical protein [Lentibacillus saliphilus]|uniref:hypothetical protein n=1 Tax=Lentibacillus saliphilus TaxID=2737028 RepID=UPI001C2F676B|nr:hypothetical protein [Lentibacillus saliphilus]
MAFVKRVIMVVCLLSVGILMTLLIVPEMNEATNVSHQLTAQKQPRLKAQTLPHISDNEIERLTAAFMDTLVQETTDTNKVIHYASKSELLDAYEKIADRDIAKRYVDFYFKEHPDGLYIVPTETAPWFDPENTYHKETISHTTVKVIQHNDSVFYGSYSIEIEFTYDETWKITSIVSE